MLALLLLFCTQAVYGQPMQMPGMVPSVTNGDILMKWYLGANCVGTPGGVINVAVGCNDYLIFGAILTLMVSKTPNATTYNVITYTDSSCTGSVGVLFINIPRNGMCVANTVMDRSLRFDGAFSPLLSLSSLCVLSFLALAGALDFLY